MNETATIELLMEKVQQTTTKGNQNVQLSTKTASSLQTNSKQIQSIQRRSFESLTAGRVRKKPQKAHGEPIGDTTVVIQLLTKDLIEKVAAHFQMLVSNTLARKNCQKGSQQTLNQHPPGPSKWEKKPKGGAKKEELRNVDECGQARA